MGTPTTYVEVFCFFFNYRRKMSMDVCMDAHEVPRVIVNATYGDGSRSRDSLQVEDGSRLHTTITSQSKLSFLSCIDGKRTAHTITLLFLVSFGFCGYLLLHSTFSHFCTTVVVFSHENWCLYFRETFSLFYRHYFKNLHKVIVLRYRILTSQTVLRRLYCRSSSLFEFTACISQIQAVQKCVLNCKC